MSERIFKFVDVIFDTGPLLLYLIGSYDINALRLFNYNGKDFYLLFEFLKNFKRIFITPQVLAEASNLAKSRLKEERFSGFISSSTAPLMSLGEEYVEKNEILKRKELPKFGITDASLIGVAERNKLLLTDDGPLFWYCNGKNVPVIHLERLGCLIYET